MTPKKKKHNEWDQQIKDLLVFVTVCEICQSAPATEHAHRLKRDLISWRTDDDRLEYWCVAKVCHACHQAMDEGTGEGVHRRMFLKVTWAITDRAIRHGKQIPQLVAIARYAKTNGWDPVRIYSVKR